MPEFYLLRHEERGASFAFRSRLNEAGKERARTALVERLQGIGPDIIVSSPYPRCLETVLPYARAVGLPVHVEWGLAEAHPHHEQVSTYWLSDPAVIEDSVFALRPLTVLDMPAIQERLCRLAQVYADKGARILFVTHQPVINAARAMEDEKVRECDPLPFGHICQVTL